MTRLNFEMDFPLTKSINYLNTASIGLVPKPVITSTTKFSNNIDRNGTKALNEEQEVKIYDDIRDTGKELFKCDSRNTIAVFNSVTEALNIIVWSLNLIRSGGKVITTDICFPSITYPWLKLASMSKIKIDFVHASNWKISEDELIQKIDENTKFVVLSHVEFLTGQIYNLKRISKHAHDVGAIVIVDGIQAAGYIPINVQEMNIDIYIVGSYKWLISPFGSAIMYISDKLKDIEPIFVGWRSVKNIWDFKTEQLDLANTARKFEYSTSAYGVKVGLAESFKYIQKIGINTIYDHNMKLISLLKTELEKINGLTIHTPLNHGSILTFEIKNIDSNEINKKFKKNKRPIELSIRQGMIRVSPHFYNTSEDILDFTTLLKKLI